MILVAVLLTAFLKIAVKLRERQKPASACDKFYAYRKQTPAVVVGYFSLNKLSRKAFITTLMEEKDMAAAAIMGFNRGPPKR